MRAVCGADCSKCELFKSNKCKGCNGCPFGKKCWIAKYIELGMEEFKTFKNEIIDEVNNLDIEGMPKIEELYPLQGSFVNMEYLLSNGSKIKLLCDDEAYLGTQVECLFNDDETKRCYGIAANMDFILVSVYGEDGSDPELIIYKKR